MKRIALSVIMFLTLFTAPCLAAYIGSPSLIEEVGGWSYSFEANIINEKKLDYNLRTFDLKSNQFGIKANNYFEEWFNFYMKTGLAGWVCRRRSVDSFGPRGGDRLVGQLGSGVEHWTQCPLPVDQRPESGHYPGIRHGTTIHQQHPEPDKTGWRRPGLR